MNPAPMARLEPADVGGLLDRVFRIYAANFAQMIGTLALVYVPYIAIIMFWQRVLMRSGSIGGTLIGALGVIVWAFLFMPLATGAMTYAIGEQYLGRPISIRESYSRAFGRLGDIIGAGFLAGLVIIIGLVLLIVPGILFALSYFVIIPAVVLDGLGATASMERSKNLAAGHRGRIFVVWLVLWLLTIMLAIGAMVLGATVFGAPRPGQSPPLASELIQDLLGLLTAPLMTIAAVIVYYDLRVRKEGFDLEMLSRAMSARPAVPLATPYGRPQAPPEPPQGPTF